MPNLRRHPRLLKLRSIALAVCGLVTAAASLGCSGNPGLRTGGVSRMKTLLAVGDRPLPVVTGEPGSAVSAEVATAPPRRADRRDEGRVSGRVYDADGRPVPGATVRLAVGPAQAGRDNRVSTDPSGAFTIRNLRPDSKYTLIAEWEGDDGLQTGRVRAASDDTGVRISLAGEEPPASVASEERPRSISRVSNSREAEVQNRPTWEDDRYVTSPVTSRTARRVPLPESDTASLNEEDLPPAPEAEAFAVGPSPVRDPESRPRASSWLPVGGIRRASVHPGDSEPLPSVPPQSRRAPVQGVPDRFEESDPAGREDGPQQPFETFRDEGPSPLPPAVERRPDDSARRDPVDPSLPMAAPFDPDPFEEEAPRVAHRERGGDPRDPQDDFGSDPPGERRGAVIRGEVGPAEPMDSSREPEPEPGALVAVPEGYAPLVLDEDPIDEQTPPLRTPSRRTAVPPAPPRLGSDPRSELRPDPFDDPSAAMDEPTSAVRLSDSRPSGAVPPGVGVPEWALSGEQTAAAPRLADALPPVAEPSVLPSRPGRAEPLVTPLGDDRPVRSPLVARNVPAVSRPTVVAAARVPKSPAEKRRPTWGEVVSAVASMPPIEGSARPAAPIAAVDLDTRPTLLVSDDVKKSAEKTKEVASTCDYDDRLRRVIDFQLQGIDGKPVRFKELDADLVLLDFWGTWCEPCVKSIPHLVDLQKKLGGKRIVVIGIACEQDAPGQAAPRVAKVAEGLKVNYPILLSRNDGSCPLQEALHIQAFPTMVLLDREGRVLWRDQGATPATLARLDRMIATATDTRAGRVTR